MHSNLRHHWSRVSSAIGRLAQHLVGHASHTWHMLVADDFRPNASGPSYRAALTVFFLLCTVCGGFLSWVGFELLLHNNQVGISARRAEWPTKWAREVASSTYIQVKKFEEGLGRIVYVEGALEFEQPFLGPLYKFLTIHPRGSVRRVPPYVSFILNYTAHQVERGRHHPCASDMISSEVAPRVDAQASGERTGIGGWYPVLGEDGQPDLKRSPWFSLEIRHDQFQWVFEKGGKPSLIISTLEALAVLMALKVFYGESPRQRRTKVLVMPTWTDNQGNGAALNKLMTTSTHGNAIMYEGVVSESPGGMDSLHRQPGGRRSGQRSNEQILGELASGCQTGESGVPDALRLGREAKEMYMNAKRQGSLPNRCIRQKRKRADERMRITDPW